MIYAVIAWSDYADGITARITGQYSRFGALLDPVVDRLLVISGVLVCFHFDLLPRWASCVLLAATSAPRRRACPDPRRGPQDQLVGPLGRPAAHGVADSSPSAG